MAIVKDKLWIFGVRAHQDDVLLKPVVHGTNPTYHFRSRITPAEAAFMLDVPNVLMIQCDGEPAPFSSEARGYMESFYRMKKVLWGSCGSGGYRVGNEEDYVCQLAEQYPNITGVYLDDINGAYSKVPDRDERHRLRVEMVAGVRRNLQKAPRPMDIYVTWYWKEDPYPGLLDQVDGLSFWTWNSEHLIHLQERFERMEKMCRGKKILLGIYLYDFYNRRPVSNEMMELQCNYGLQLLEEGRIDGMIIEANSTMGAGLPSEYWLRDWLKEVKSIEIPD